VKIFVLPLPDTPEELTAHPDPVPLVHSGASSGIQTLPNGRLLFSRSSFTAPNDAYLIRDLHSFEASLKASPVSPPEFKGKIDQITRFTASDLEGKDLDQGEEFWFKGALDKDVQGWVFKPKGWKKSDKKKWPVVLGIHGGKSCENPQCTISF
jgi:dipeptidyl aminopeptidase/acylaminoacyl peptidase